MDKNKAIKLIQEIEEDGRNVTSEHIEALDYAISQLEKDRWIPVSEKLPEDYTKVLITNEYGIVTCVIWNTWYQNEYTDAKKEYKAIAWKPVPKRYESEDNK